MQRPLKIATALAVLASTVWLTGCVGLAATGVAVGAMSAMDRRTIGAQTEDTEIELRLAGSLPGAVKGAENVSITSFNRRVLLTGQVPDEATKAAAQRQVASYPPVRQVHNELTVGPAASFSTKSNDSLITTRVKSEMLNQKALSVNAVKVVTESGVVYLMGLVTEREGPAYAGVASRVPGVTRVVTLFEYITEEELKRIVSQ